MRNRVRLAAGVVFAALALGMVPSVGRTPAFEAAAQNLGQRVVSGLVLDDAGATVSGATVFLRNSKTKSIRSYTSTQDGKFRFAQVNMAEDYELWAEKAGKKSPIKGVSSWDASKEFRCELKLKE